jgi:branched-chain amino acid transport system permease protein
MATAGVDGEARAGEGRTGRQPVADAPEGDLPLAGYRVRTGTSFSRIALIVLAAILILAFIAPVFIPRSMIQDLFFLVTMIGLAQCWNLLAGYGGLVSVGQQAYVGLGAYLSFGAAILLGLDPLLAILVGALGATLLALPAAYVVFRLKGAYFAIGTWVAAEVFRLLFAQWKALGGGTGTSMPSDIARSMVGIDQVGDLLGLRSSAARDVLSYWLALIAVILITGGAYALLRSRAGLALAAIRDNEGAAESVGVDNTRLKLLVYLFAAAGASLVGGLIFFQKASLTPDSAFSVIDWTAYVIFITVIGGIGTLEGPIIGALILLALQAWLAEYGSWYLMLLGLLGILVMLFAPKGIWGFVQERFDVAVFPTRRRLIGPDSPVPDYTRPVKDLAAAPSFPGVDGAAIALETPMFDIETDVLIVGSGPAGAASACLLSSYGVQNVMVEKYAWLANTPRAHITNQRTMEILRELGLEEEAVLRATPQELMGNNIFCTSLAGEELGRLLTWGNHPERRADYELASPTRMCDLPQTPVLPTPPTRRAKSGSSALMSEDFPTPEGPMRSDTPSERRAPSSAHPAPVWAEVRRTGYPISL